MSIRSHTSCRRMASLLVALVVATTVLMTSVSATLANGGECPQVRNNATYSKDLLMSTYWRSNGNYMVDLMGVYDLFIYAPEDIGGGQYVWLWSDEYSESPNYLCSTFYP